MSRAPLRAAALLLLHQQQLGGGPLPIAPAHAEEQKALPPALRWYQRLWARLRDRYNLVGWQES